MILYNQVMVVPPITLVIGLAARTRILAREALRGWRILRRKGSNRCCKSGDLDRGRSNMVL